MKSFTLELALSKRAWR